MPVRRVGDPPDAGGIPDCLPHPVYQNAGRGDLFAHLSQPFEVLGAEGAEHPVAGGEIIPLERARRRCFVESHYFNPVQSRVEDERLYIKPAGEYAVYDYQGELEDLVVAFHHFVDEVERQGYQLCGDVYEDDLVEELLLSQTALSVARLTARVEKMER